MSRLEAFMTAPHFLNDLNNYDTEHEKEQESDLDDVDTIPDLVLDTESYVHSSYEQVDGLVAYPDPGTYELQSLISASQSDHSDVSDREVRTRKALGVGRSILLVTLADEPSWNNEPTAQPFAAWTTLTPRELSGSESLAKHLWEEKQKRWDAVNPDISILGYGGSIAGAIGLIRSWCVPQDLIDLYTTSPRHLYVRPDATEDPINLEKELFGTIKYSGTSTYFTVVTYGSGSSGTAELYEVTRNADGLAKSIAPLAAAKRVPKVLLKALKDAPRRIELVRKQHKTRLIRAGHQSAPLLAQVETHVPQAPDVKWSTLGQAWRDALRTVESSLHEGLVATIPQMISLLHLNGSGLHAMTSTPIHEFSTPLVYNQPADLPPSSLSDLEVTRGVKLLEGPRCDAHYGTRIKVVVLFPRESAWANEKILWF